MTGHLTLDLRQWVIAYAGSAGQGYVGRIGEDKTHSAYLNSVMLETPYILASGYVVTPQGQLARPMMLFPLELLVSPVPMRVHYDALLRLRDLDDADFKALEVPLRAGIEQAEGMRAAIRSQRSGVVLAPAGVKLPPMGGRG